MCLIISRKGNSRPKIASEDILVWKILKRGNLSQFHDFTYKRNVINKTEIKEFVVDDENGVNVYGIKVIKGLRERDGSGWYKSVDLFNENYIFGEGFHSIGNYDDANKYFRNAFLFFDGRGYSLEEFIIPKGSKYYIDENDLLISDTIILKNHKK